MKKEFSPWLFLIGFFILVNFPKLFVFLLFGAAIFFLFQKFSSKNEIFSDDFFGKKPPPIDVSPQKSPFSFFQKMPNFPTGKIIAGIFGGLFLLAIVADGFVNIPPGFVGVVSDKGRGVLPDELPVGLHLKIPFWQTVVKMETRILSYTMSSARGEGEKIGDDSIEALTKDGQKVSLDVTVLYLIDAKNADKIYAEIGTQKQIEEKIIRPTARSVIREVITGFESKQLFDDQSRAVASTQIEKQLREKYAKNFILLDSALLRNVRFSKIYLNAIEEKQVAEQKIQKAEFEKQEAEIKKQKTIIEAEAEAKAISLKGDALQKNPEVIQLKFVEKMAPQINWGILPDGALPLIDLKNLQK